MQTHVFLKGGVGGRARLCKASDSFLSVLQDQYVTPTLRIWVFRNSLQQEYLLTYVRDSTKVQNMFLNQCGFWSLRVLDASVGVHLGGECIQQSWV